MELKQVEKKYFDEIINKFNMIFYNTSSFQELNKDKVEKIQYLISFSGNSPRFAFPFGIIKDSAQSPFSAPFSLPIVLKKSTSISHYEEALLSLENYFKTNNIKEIRFILPPLFYNNEELTSWINTFYRLNYNTTNIDINYVLDLKKSYNSQYIESIEYNARKNLKIALKSNLELCYCINNQDKKEAYDVIAENRSSKGYPLRMSYKQVMDTIELVKHDMFLVKSNNQSIAAALVYNVAPKIAQVIYWGDRPGYSNLKPINFLSYQLIQHYGQHGYEYLDIGPSTENSIPNYGLCDFKESIGCERGLKFTFTKSI